MDRDVLLAEHSYLETQRLILKPVTLADAQAMFDYASDEETTKHVFEKHGSLEQTKLDMVQFFLRDPIGKYGIFLKEKPNILIGTIDLRINQKHHSAEVGYILNKNFWGQGIVAEAFQKLIELSFERLKLNRVWAMHDVDNSASGRVMQKAGLIYEGCCKQMHYHKGKYIDMALYGLTLHDYEKQKK